MSVRIRCQVVEVPTHEWMPRGDQTHRELLPWADPYIALLMQRLEERFDAAEVADTRFGPRDNSSRFDDREDVWDEGDWNAHLEGAPASRLPAVYGGWPLLEDVKELCDDDAL